MPKSWASSGLKVGTLSGQTLGPTLTEDLGPGESRERLQAAEEVAVGVGQVSVQLAEVAVPLPDHHLRRMPDLKDPAMVGKGLPYPQPGPGVWEEGGTVEVGAGLLTEFFYCFNIWNWGMVPLPPRSLTSLTSSGSLFEMN